MSHRLVTLAGLLWLSCVGNPFAQASGEEITVTMSRRVQPLLIRNEAKGLLQIIVNVQRDKEVRVQAMQFALDGADDLASLELFATGDKHEFSPTSTFGQPHKAARMVAFRGDLALQRGKNVFWLSCRLKTTADLSHRVAAVCTSVETTAGKLPARDLSPGVRQRIGIALRKHKDDGVHTYRIPSLATTPQGTLLCVYDMRRRMGRDLQEDIDIGLSRSTDGGRTWEGARVILDMGEYGGLPQEQNGCSDPGIIVDQKTGVIYCFAVWMNGNPGKHQWTGDGSLPGYEIGKAAQFLMVSSRDDGRTWTKPVNLTRRLKKAEWWLFAPSPQQGINLADGTLVMPVQGRDHKGVEFSTVMTSRDHGATWTVGAPAYSGGSECQAVQLGDGAIMLNMRNERGRFRAVFVTRDLGRTWQAHETNCNTLIEPNCNGSLLRFDYTEAGAKKHLLLFANPHSQKGRTHQTIQVSFDDGRTWPAAHHMLLDEGRGAGYPSLTRLDERHIGIVYEGSQAHLVFEKIPLAELLKPAARSVAATAWKRGLVGHWKLVGDTKDSSGRGNHGENHGADLTAPGPEGKPNGAARFDGKKAYIQVPASKSLNLGTNDFTFTVWAHTDERLDDVLGDLVSKYDPVARRGINWCIKNGAGITNSQSNYRNVHFGIDAGSEPKWTDCGRPGDAVYVMALAVHDGRLFAGTCEPGKGQAGHVYRYAGGARWVDCGRPDNCNAVTALAAHGGSLYAGTGRYRLAGSSLPESLNANLGGKIFRYDADGKWTDCGRLPNTEAIGGMVVYRGDFYAASLYKPAGFFRHKGGRDWVACALPQDGRRVVALAVFNGHLYATSYDACAVYRFDGATWANVGTLESTGQTYSFEVFGGELYVGTWPNGRVFRHEGGKKWVSAGRLGEEKEVMGMAVHNGKLYAGTLPTAEVYRYDGGTTWTRTGRLDWTPEVRYRRAWSMAVFQGRLFCGTLPSGHVHALDAGSSVTHDHELRPGWRHLAAVRQGGRLKLFVDGKLVAISSPFDPSAFDLTNDQPLKIGFGTHDYLRGSLSDLRLYGRALAPHEIATLGALPGKHERR